MLDRIGQRKPKIFVTLELTSGFHQCPVAENSQDYTTFTTTHGNYKWKRLPMGLKNAPAYFQKEMAKRVFPDMIGKQIEVYLDDILIFAQTEQLRAGGC
jgi:hypothetical protein